MWCDCQPSNAGSSKREPVGIRCRIEMWCGPRSCSWPPMATTTTRSRCGWTPAARSCRSGASASSSKACPAWRSAPGAVDPRSFPPEVVVAVKALACELPSRLGVPLSRLHIPDIATEVAARGIVADISGTTIWRWLSEDAIRPWRHRSWIFPRDPNFATKAGRVLDLYAREWDGKRLGKRDFVISADEKTSIQARVRCHQTLAPAAGRDTRVEHEYERGGALQYLAAWDVHRAKIFGRCEPKTGIEPFGRLVAQVMTSEPYASAQRVFWIVDYGSSHAGKRSVDRLQGAWPNLVLVHLPVHASWLNQIEIYFSILQRKALNPRHFASLTELDQRIINFQRDWQQHATPIDWRYTRRDLNRLLDRINHPNQLPRAA